jgi:hypothetical protein
MDNNSSTKRWIADPDTSSSTVIVQWSNGAVRASTRTESGAMIPSGERQVVAVDQTGGVDGPGE